VTPEERLATCGGQLFGYPGSGLWFAGGLHSPDELAALGLLTFSSSRAGREVVCRVKNEYIDFMELPPAKGKARSVPTQQEGQVVVVHTTDMPTTRRTIPDLATWTKYFALYVAVLAPQQPQREPELMAYQGIIVKASMKYKWPLWVVYDASFHQEMAGTVASCGQESTRVFMLYVSRGRLLVLRTGALTVTAWIIRCHHAQFIQENEGGSQHLGETPGLKKQTCAKNTTGSEETAGSIRSTGSGMCIRIQCHGSRWKETSLGVLQWV